MTYRFPSETVASCRRPAPAPERERRGGGLSERPGLDMPAQADGETPAPSAAAPVHGAHGTLQAPCRDPRSDAPAAAVRSDRSRGREPTWLLRHGPEGAPAAPSTRSESCAENSWSVGPGRSSTQIPSQADTRDARPRNRRNARRHKTGQVPRARPATRTQSRGGAREECPNTQRRSPRAARGEQHTCGRPSKLLGKHT